MWDEEDYFGRWVQGIFAVIFAVAAVGGLYMVFHSTLTMIIFGGVAATARCLRLCYRCARYAITGRGNVNRDNY